MDVKVPSPQTTLLVLLGASTWPFSPEFQSSEAFANAARRLKAYFLNPRPFGLPPENLLDLFDTDKSTDELDVAMGQFLERRLIAMKAAGTPAKDLLLYFVGHGGFVGQDHDFYLAIRRTRMDNPLVSGLQMTSLAHTLTERARHLRRIIILDCCFAAAAFSAFQGGPDQVALEKTVDAFQVGRKAVGIPTKGTTLLCSSNHKSPSLLLPDDSSTMFTKAFLDALVQGTPSQQGYLTLRDVRDVAADFLAEIHNAPKPEVHSPDQSDGDVADLPFFPNARVEKERWRRAEEEERRRAEEQARREEEEQHRAEEQARREEEERERRAEEERIYQAQEQASKIEEEERIRLAEERRHRQPEEVHIHKTEESSSGAQLFQNPVFLETGTSRSDQMHFSESIHEAPQISRRGWRISRRKVLVGLVAAGGVAVSGGITWFILAPRPHLLYKNYIDQVDTECIAWSPDGKYIAFGGDIFGTEQNNNRSIATVEVVIAADGGNVYTYRGDPVPAVDSTVYSVEWSPSGNRIASGGSDNTVQVWNPNDGSDVYTYRKHTKSVKSVAWSPSGNRIASAGYDKTVQVWDATDGSHVYTYRGHSGPVNSVAWSPDGKRIASGDSDNTIQVWNATDGNDVYTYDQGILAVWSPDGKRIVYKDGNRGSQIYIWQMP